MIALEELRGLYDDYVECLDDLHLEEWPGFFAEICLYCMIPRENYERGYALATMQAESRGMLQDRVTALRRTQVFAPRAYRRFLSGLRIKENGPDGARVRQNVLVVQTLVDRQSEIVVCGVAHDFVVRTGGRLLFRERVVVMDSEMLPNSLIYPA